MTNTVNGCLDLELSQDYSRQNPEPYWLGLDPNNPNIRTREPYIDPEVLKHFEIRVDQFDIRKQELRAKPGVLVLGDPVKERLEDLPDHPRTLYAVVLVDGTKVIIIEEDASLSVDGVPPGIYNVIKMEEVTETE